MFTTTKLTPVVIMAVLIHPSWHLRPDVERGIRPSVPDSPVRTPPEDARSASPNAEGKAAALARTIWPEGCLPRGKVAWFCEMFARMAIKDASLVHFRASASDDGASVVLQGATNAPGIKSALEAALVSVGIGVGRNEIRTLPDRSVLGEEMFAVCIAAEALTYHQPGSEGPVQTQLLFGDTLFLLDHNGGYFLLHAADGYWGWVDERAVQPMSRDGFESYRSHANGVALCDVKLGKFNAPRGAQLRLVGSEGEDQVVLMPDGSRSKVPSVVLRIGESEGGAAADRVSSALDLLGAPYVFGGRSPSGLDCSGLITNVWARAGSAPARDAWQQALAGTLVATSWHREGIRPGDQVFFIDGTGKIYHTGIAIDATHVLHAAPPKVQIGSFKTGDGLYDPRLDRDFFMAKRP